MKRATKEIIYIIIPIKIYIIQAKIQSFLAQILKKMKQNYTELNIIITINPVNQDKTMQNNSAFTSGKMTILIIMRIIF